MHWKYLPYQPALAICFAFIAACGRAPSSPTPTNKAIATILTVTPSSSPASTPSLTATYTSTPSPTATETPSPTSTPTLALPVYLGTSFPQSLQAITAENIAGLRELAYFGSPTTEGFQITRDGNLGFLKTSVGVAVYDLTTSRWKGLYDTVSCTGRFLTCRQDALVLSHDGSRFAMLAQNSAQVWDLNSKLIFEMPLVSLERYSNLVAISPDGRLLAVRDNDNTVIYNIDSGQALSGLPTFQGWDFQFSPDGAYFVEWIEMSNRNSTGTIWRVSDWSKVRGIFLTAGQYVRDFSQDGRMIALQDDEQLALYQVEGWRLKRQVPVHSDKARRTLGVMFSPSGEKFTVWESIFDTRTLTSEELVRVWDIPTGEQLSEQQPPLGSVAVFTLGDDGALTPYQVPEGMCEGLGMACLAQPMSFAYTDTQFQMLTAPEAGLEACSVQPGATQTCVEASANTFLNTDGQFYTIVKTEEPSVYEVRRGADGDGRPLGRFRTTEQELNSFAPRWLSADGRLLLFSSFTRLGGLASREATELWDVQQETRIKKWPDTLRRLHVSRDGNHLALGFWNSEQLVYAVADHRVVFSSNERSDAAWAFTEAGDLIHVARSLRDMGPNRNTWYAFELSLIDLEALKRTSLIQVVQDEFYMDAVALSPDGRLLAVGLPDGTIRVFDMITKQDVSTWQAHAGNVTQLGFSPDGGLLISLAQGSQNGGDGFLRVWGIWP